MSNALSCLLILFVAAGAQAQEAQTSPAAVAFRSLDLYVDPAGESLAAYQVELSAGPGSVQFVGIEGGEHPAFRSPPFYDPKALRRERLILAAYNAAAAEALPKVKTRVATVHFQTIAGQVPQFAVKVQTAAGATKKLDSVVATVVARKNK